MEHRTGGDHLGVKQRPPRQQPVEIPAVPVGPLHHGSDAETMRGGVQARRSGLARSAFAGGVQRGLYASALKRSARERPARAAGSTFAPDADRTRVIALARAVWAPLFWLARAARPSCVARWRRRGRP